LKTYELPADTIQLELTEGILMSESPAKTTAMAELERMGIKLLIDDYGTGYASLSCLQRYHFDCVKIDRSLINNIVVNEQDAQLLKALVAMAKTLGISVACEGVETGGQLDILLDAHCQFAQGNYFSKAVSAREFEILFNKSNSTNPKNRPLELVTAVSRTRQNNVSG
jgi:EAL domain-containing protein (putative c-di-GMP-specific phosphodiesterase class I)